MSKLDAELEAAMEDLQALLDERLDQTGGYPAQCAIVADFIVIADIDHDDAPELTILHLDKFVALWKVARVTMARAGVGGIAEHLYEAGYPVACQWEDE